MPIQVSKQPDAFRDFERTGWNTVSEGYEAGFGPLTAQSVDVTLDAAGVIGGCDVLDVCTGHGVLALAATERGAKVSAVDFSDAMVAAARRNVPSMDCRQGDAQDLPYPDNAFDAVVCGYGILHVPEPDRALAEMRRVLRPGGRVAISVWERPSPANGFGLLLGTVKVHGRVDVPLPHGPDFFQFGDPEDMKAALAQADFSDVAATTVVQTLLLKTATGLVNLVLQGGVRIRALLLAQDSAALSAINAAVAEGMDQLFRKGDRFQVPMPAILGSGTKPRQ
ncbi:MULTISPECIES: class I SAM-dependent methyltransferase [unclassified Bradyrhizobium]|uniref:class I SAM-dependent methyltransferase n=1 Tax=unclassified Bradyrhizobium TaxID=2631580 RepID=UPI00048DC055|nr:MULTISPECIES: methyltransferase domain-containing protein [unclassified Bradyrhizobium]QIG98968.1 methyltransferase domain-containing protein [Bradyrhizobium sp. 6(2017)]